MNIADYVRVYFTCTVITESIIQVCYYLLLFTMW